MNDIIRLRRSVRKFTPEKIDQPTLDLLLEAAMSAPSAGNQQPWQFMVITNRQTIESLSHTGPNSKPALGAPVLIVVLADTSRERYKDYWPIDCSAATENLLLEATRLGLGSVWLGVHPVDDRKAYITNLFALPPHIIPFSIVCVGYPEEAPLVERPSRFDASRVHYNKW